MPAEKRKELGVYCTAPGCVYAGTSDGFAMDCPECGGKLELERPVEEIVADVKEAVELNRKADELEAQAARLEPETDLPSFPPYSVGVFFRNARDAGKDNLSGPRAIEYAAIALADPKVEGVEVYDRVNNLVLTGSRENGLRLIRKLGDVAGDAIAKVEKADPALADATFIAQGGDELDEIYLRSRGETTRIRAVEIVVERRNLRKLLEAALLAKVILFDEGEKLGRLWAPVNPDDRDDVRNLVAYAPREKLREALAPFGL